MAADLAAARVPVSNTGASERRRIKPPTSFCFPFLLGGIGGGVRRSAGQELCIAQENQRC